MLEKTKWCWCPELKQRHVDTRTLYARPAKKEKKQSPPNPILNKFGEKISLIFFSHARASLNARIYGSAWWSAKRWINPSTIDHRLTWATPGKIMKKSCTWWISKLKYRVRFKTISSGGRCLTNTIRICDHCECWWCCIPWNRILTNPAKNTFQYFIPAHGKKTV